MVVASGSRAAPLRQLDGLEIQETDPGEPASPSIPRLDTGGGASHGTATSDRADRNWFSHLLSLVFLGSAAQLGGGVEAVEPSGPLCYWACDSS